MSKRRDADVVIIGGGITGCAAAYHLAKRGKRVTVVEKGETAGEASGRNTEGCGYRAVTRWNIPSCWSASRCGRDWKRSWGPTWVT